MIHCISDLHYGVCEDGDRAVLALASHLVRVGTAHDVLLLGGDIATDDDMMHACLSLFAEYRGVRAAISGNHDVWSSSGDSSWERYQRLPDIFRRAGFHPLEEQPLIHEGVGIVGAMGWYDGSFKDDIDVPPDSYARKFDPALGVGWQDGASVNWEFSDREMTAMQVERLAVHLEQVKRIEDVLVLTHHLPTKRLLFHPRWLVPKSWRFTNAFLGAEVFSQLFRTHTNVRRVVSGHVHRAQQMRIGSQRYYTIGGSYRTKQLLVLDGNRVKRQTFNG